jgi:hypothetical protein
MRTAGNRPPLIEPMLNLPISPAPINLAPINLALISPSPNSCCVLIQLRVENKNV